MDPTHVSDPQLAGVYDRGISGGLMCELLCVFQWGDAAGTTEEPKRGFEVWAFYGFLGAPWGAPFLELSPRGTMRYPKRPRKNQSSESFNMFQWEFQDPKMEVC